MKGVLVDSNIILDVFEADPAWVEWSESLLEFYSTDHSLYINPVIYAEVSIGFEQIEELEDALTGCDFEMIDIPKSALFRAGKAFMEYRKRGSAKTSRLPDFFIGAHAEAAGFLLLTRDSARYKTYFPSVKVISPENDVPFPETAK
ncbi:PilT protein domain protein [Candidatus Vecturithrix granuli]|uniref:PilT protein domain protein n=1 Tax=Vecturithrix granuli TaxID=1499967 RepID=A0A081C1E0_VECG1|nr:PilT protein domain protein [Candidatus Vecturithrix granuli]